MYEINVMVEASIYLDTFKRFYCKLQHASIRTGSLHFLLLEVHCGFCILAAQMVVSPFGRLLQC